MTDQKDVSVMDAAEESSIKPEQTSSSPNRNTSQELPRRAAGNGGLWLVLILTVGVIAAAGWYIFQLVSSQQQAMASLVEQVDRQEQSQTSKRQQLELALGQNLTRQQQDVRTALSDVEQRLENLNTKFSTVTNVSRDDWKLAEAEYLLRLANQRVMLERSSSNAIALAETVDDILRQLNDPELFAVRRALAGDISDLKLAGDIDREGIYLRLNALAQQTEKLLLVEPLGENEDPWQLDEQDASQTSWWSKFKSSANQLLQKFSHHLRVRDHAQPVAAILPPDNQMYLKQNLRLMLEQAQLSLLREDAQIYQTSLDKAREWLETYFPLNPQSLAVRAEVADLQGVMISQSLPTFTDSINLLREYSERRLNKSVERSGGH